MNDTHTKQLKENVIKVATDLFLRNGIRAVKMDDLAAELKISKRTLYQLFADKATLLEACLRQRLEENDQYMEEISSHTDDVMEVILRHGEINLTTIKNLPKDFMKEMALYPNLTLLRQQHHKAQEAKAIEFMMRGVEQGVLRPDINFQLLYQVLNTFITASSQANNKLALYSPLEVVCSLFIPLLRGCATEIGARRINAFAKRNHLTPFGGK